MTPLVNGQRLHFEASGLYDGLVLLGDRQTRSYWHHSTGECLHGQYEGEKLEISNLFHYTFKRALEEYPDLRLGISNPPPYVKIVLSITRRFLKSKHNVLPPFFKKTIQETDDRLDEQTMGLGVIIEDCAKFYPLDIIKAKKIIEDSFCDRTILVTYNEEHHFPKCTDPKNNDMPMQLFTRWYGFSLTNKNCEIYEGR